MSGLFGVLSSRPDFDGAYLIGRMGEAMAHFGWFVAETWSDERIQAHLGRIGIGIFNRESQPVWDEDRNIAVFLSGEFYATQSLRGTLKKKGVRLRNDGDAELAMRLYREMGISCVEFLEGAFVLAVWDRLKQRLAIANDRFGLYPLYYAHANGRLLFAPEVKGILCDGAVGRSIDWVALSEYACFQTLLGDKTFFEGIRLLDNASVMTYEPGTDSLRISPYWDFSRVRPQQGRVALEEAAEEGGRLLSAAVARCFRGDFRKAIHLSAGLDSRAILGLADCDPSSMVTLTYGMPRSRDFEYAGRVARKAGTRHYSFPFHDGRWVAEHADLHLDLTEGFHSWIHSHGISILPECRQFVDVSLSGFAGGDIDWEEPALLNAPDDVAFLNLLYAVLSQKTTWPSFQGWEEKLLYDPKVFKLAGGRAFDSLKMELGKFGSLSYPVRALAFSRVNPDRRMFQYYVVFHRAFIELRFPFCDYAYADFIFSLPPEILFQRRLRSGIIRRFCPSLAGIPCSRDDLPLAQNETYRSALKLFKKGKHWVNRRSGSFFRPLFPLNSDYESWLRGELKDWGEELLLDRRTLERGIFNPEYLRSLWARHQAGLEPFTIGKIAPIMTYEMMLRRFYDA